MATDTTEPLKLPRHTGPILAVVSVVVFMIVPMVSIKHMATAPVASVNPASAIGATVALGALFRAGGRTMLRSTVMSAARTMARALTRRIVRSFLPMALRLFLPAFRSSTLDETLSGKMAQPFWLALLLGTGTLGLSFFGVARLSEERHRLERELLSVEYTYRNGRLIGRPVERRSFGSPVVAFYHQERVVLLSSAVGDHSSILEPSSFLKRSDGRTFVASAATKRGNPTPHHQHP